MTEIIYFNPITGLWIRCLQAYRWVQQFHENKDLFQTCRRLNIASLVVLTPAQVLLNVNECTTWLEHGIAPTQKLYPNRQLHSCWGCQQYHCHSREQDDGYALLVALLPCIAGPILILLGCRIQELGRLQHKTPPRLLP